MMFCTSITSWKKRAVFALSKVIDFSVVRLCLFSSCVSLHFTWFSHGQRTENCTFQLKIISLQCYITHSVSMFLKLSLMSRRLQLTGHTKSPWKVMRFFWIFEQQKIPLPVFVQFFTMKFVVEEVLSLVNFEGNKDTSIRIHPPLDSFESLFPYFASYFAPILPLFGVVLHFSCTLTSWYLQHQCFENSMNRPNLSTSVKRKAYALQFDIVFTWIAHRFSNNTIYIHGYLYDLLGCTWIY